MRRVIRSASLLSVIGLTAPLVLFLPGYGKASPAVQVHGAGSVVRAPGWTAEGNQEFANLGFSVASAGDVNGDGYDDVIVGAWHYGNGQELEGRALAYYGSATGPSTSADWTAESNQIGASFGISVAGAGDVNGDGFDDVIVGAYTYDNGQDSEGRAFAYYGSATGLSTSADWTAESNQIGANFGISVAGAGDVNGDGFDDAIVGAYNYDNGQDSEGRAFAYHGSPAGLSTTANWTAEPNHVSAFFGYSVAGAGDVNGDGFDDAIVGADGFGLNDKGRAFAYYGSAAGLSATDSWIAEPDRCCANFGNSVAGAGDVNGDGYGDAIVGAYNYDHGQIDEGRAFAYYGSAAGLSATADWTAESNQAGAGFGGSVAGAGDVNGDGFQDVVVGAPYFEAAFLVRGTSVGLGTASSRSESNQVGARYGVSVAGAGDVNGDGFDDMIVGADFYDHGQADEGVAFLTYGRVG
jgi:hypothetical protein